MKVEGCPKFQKNYEKMYRGAIITDVQERVFFTLTLFKIKIIVPPSTFIVLFFQKFVTPFDFHRGELNGYLPFRKRLAYSNGTEHS